jgi:hypothetical protein
MKFVSVDVRTLAARFKALGAHVDRGGNDVFLQPYAMESDELETTPAAYQAVPARLAKMINRLEELRQMAAAAGIPDALLRDEGTDGKEGFAERLLTFTASDETRDRYGDRILVDGTLALKDGSIKKFGKGWQLDNFRKNPVFMPFHSYSTIPLGQAVDTWTDQKGKRKRLRMTVLMNDGTANPLAPLITAAYKARDMRSVSVGFMPIKAHYPEDAEERAALDLGPYGYIFGEQELWENSAVAIPANPNATDETKGVDASQVAGLMRLADAAQDVEPTFALQLRAALPSTRTIVDLGAVDKDTATETDCRNARQHVRRCEACADHVTPKSGELVELVAGDEAFANSVAARILKTPEFGELAGVAKRLDALTALLVRLSAGEETAGGTTKAGDAPADPTATTGTPDEPSIYDKLLDVQSRTLAALGNTPGA